MDLYQKHRPRTLDDVVGQPQAVSIMRKWKRVPHCVLYHGNTGTGKSTLAGIQCDRLGASKENGNLYEIDTATANGVQQTREICDRMEWVGLGRRVNGKEPARVWVWNEAHLMSREAQSALLMPTENPRPHVYFIFCTTDPAKVLPALRNRCTQVELKRVGDKDLKALVDKVAKLERPKVPIQIRVRDEIVRVADGCARQALQDLQKVLPFADEKVRLNAITAIEMEKKAIDLARLLIQPKRPAWGEVAKLVRDINDDPEAIRRVVVEYAASVLLNGAKNPKACAMIEAFGDNYNDSKRGGLLLSCLAMCDYTG